MVADRLADISGPPPEGPAADFPLAYVLDRWQRIEHIEGPWDAFAAENGAPQSLCNRILGAELWSFVAGIETRAFLNAAFYWCLCEHICFGSDYRCDAPGLLRWCRMEVQPLGLGVLRVEHRTLRREAIGDPPGSSAIEIAECRCSICCRFQVGAHWIEPATVPAHRFVASAHVVCPECRSGLRAALRAQGRALLHPFGVPR